MLKNLIPIAILFCIFSCTGPDTPTYDDTLVPANNLPVPQPITFTVDSVYPHDTEAFTEGLEFRNGKLYESTGEPKKSSLRIVDIKSGQPEKKYLIPDASIFGEGITIMNDKIYQLTWQNKKVFIYKKNDIFKPVATLNWNYEGWGLTNDGSKLIISDGSDKLYFVSPDEQKKEMRILKILSVRDNRGSVDSLNELEYVNGYVYANRWYNNTIVKIDTANGHVAGKIDLTGLLPQYAPGTVVKEGDVLNGIAYDSATQNFYVTGKNWPKLFRLKLN